MQTIKVEGSRDAMASWVNTHFLKYKKDGSVYRKGLHDATVFVSRADNILSIKDCKENIALTIRYDELLEILKSQAEIVEDKNV